MRDAMAAACRRVALVSLARASASYQPSSYDDAAALRVSVGAALDTEITEAGDAGEDASYLALKALRSAVVRYLTVRGASLPSVVTVVLGAPMPLPDRINMLAAVPPLLKNAMMGPMGCYNSTEDGLGQQRWNGVTHLLLLEPD